MTFFRVEWEGLGEVCGRSRGENLIWVTEQASGSHLVPAERYGEKGDRVSASSH